MADAREFNEQVRHLARHCLQTILRELEEQVAENENLQRRLAWLLRVIVRYESTVINHAVVDLLADALACIGHSVETGVSAGTMQIFSQTPGRQKFNIPYEQLNFLVERGFTTVKMAELLGVSVRTIEPRFQEFGLSVRATYTEITDVQLDETVCKIMVTFPNTGYKRMSGYLRSRGIRIQQKQVREAMRCIDPEGTILRALEMNVIQQRVYSVPSPLPLWHIDGNHKLIRYIDYP
jgi:hypothetical protein